MEDFTYHRPVLGSGSGRTARATRPAHWLSMRHAGRGHTEAIFCAPAQIPGARSGSGCDRACQRTGSANSVVVSLCGRPTFATPESSRRTRNRAALVGAFSISAFRPTNWKTPSVVSVVMRNGPLDMRMDPRRDLTAAEIVNHYSEEELTRLFRDLGEEPAARRIASQLVKVRKIVPFQRRSRLPTRSRRLSGGMAGGILLHRFFRRCGWK